MSAQNEVLNLLRQHDFELVRQRKHKVYRNPEGLTFVVASTPSDRNADYNALATLKRLLRTTSVNTPPTPSRIETTASVTSDVFEPTTPACMKQEEVPLFENIPPVTDIAAVVETAPASEPAKELSEREWQDWKRRCWHDEKMRAKNEKFLSAVEDYVGRASAALKARQDVSMGVATDAVKSFLRDMRYRSKVLFYHATSFRQGVITWRSEETGPPLPILWATNGHIGISSCIALESYIQHGPERLKTLRFECEGDPVIFEFTQRPEGLSFY